MNKNKNKHESIVEGIQREAAEEVTRRAERDRLEEVQRLRARLESLRSRNETLERDLVVAKTTQDVLRFAAANPLKPTRIPARERSLRVHEGTAVLVLSDCHLDEEVDPAEVNGLNEFNPEIAIDRMHRLGVGVAWNLELARAKAKGEAGYQIHELLVMAVGDFTTNYLHVGEDHLGNALTPYNGVIFGVGLIERALRYVLRTCPWIKVVRFVIVPGNHDRLPLTRKTPFRKRVELSTAPIIAHMLTTQLADEPRVRIELSASEHVYVDVYGKLIRGMHGDRFNYGGGVGGIFIPARRHVLGLNKAIDAAFTVFGHWHQSRKDDRWLSNGSVIGFNSYSMAKGLDPEPPSQTMLMIDKRRGIKLVNPIQVGTGDHWS